MGQKYSDKQLKEAKEIFDLFDQNKDGSISAKEIGEVLREMGDDPTDEEVETMLKEDDIDGNGSISYEEFLEVMAPRFLDLPVADDDSSAREVFKSLDTNNDGTISLEELKKGAVKFGRGYSESDIEAMFKKADIEKKGQITIQDFVKFFKKKV